MVASAIGPIISQRQHMGQAHAKATPIHPSLRAVVNGLDKWGFRALISKGVGAFDRYIPPSFPPGQLLPQPRLGDVRCLIYAGAGPVSPLLIN